MQAEPQNSSAQDIPALSVIGSVMVANLAGLHARPAVLLTQAAKRFATTSVEFALVPEGPWLDAKSPVRMMRAKASKGTMLHFRCQGPEADEALHAMIGLVEQKFGEE
jgi:phosphocarrier protein HPr